MVGTRPSGAAAPGRPPRFSIATFKGMKYRRAKLETASNLRVLPGERRGCIRPRLPPRQPSLAAGRQVFDWRRNGGAPERRAPSGLRGVCTSITAERKRFGWRDVDNGSKAEENCSYRPGALRSLPGALMSILPENLKPTPTLNESLPLKLEVFPTLTDALDYAAQGETGCNFVNLRGEIYAAIPYSSLRRDAMALARRLAARFERGSRPALVADTSPDFLTTFFACQYAGMIPAPMPLPVNLGGKDGYLTQVRLMVQGSKAAAAIGPASLTDFMTAALGGNSEAEIVSFDELKAFEAEADAIPFGPDEACYIQYSSGSTSAPKGVIGTQKSVNANLHGITKYGLKLVGGDRAASWLPLYHDMGLIGFVLAPMYGQRSVDYIATSDF